MITPLTPPTTHESNIVLLIYNGRWKTTQSIHICLCVWSPAPDPVGAQELGTQSPRPLGVLCLAGRGDMSKHPWDVCVLWKNLKQSQRSFTWSGRGAMTKTNPPRVPCSQAVCCLIMGPAHCLQTCLSTPGLQLVAELLSNTGD